MQRYRPYNYKRRTHERNVQELKHGLFWIAFGCIVAFPILALLTK